MQSQKKISGSIFIFFVLFLLSSCSYNKMTIQKTDDFSKVENIDKLVIIDPFYFHADERKKSKKNLFKSYDMEINFVDVITKSANQAKLPIEVVSGETLKATDVDYFNDIIPLKDDIFYAFANYEAQKSSNSKVKKGRNMYKPANTFYKNELEVGSRYSHLKDKYGTPYFSVTGVINIKEKASVNIVTMIVAFPIEIINALTTNNSSLYYNFVVNVETGNLIYKEIREFDAPLTKENMSAVVFDSFKILTK